VQAGWICSSVRNQGGSGTNAPGGERRSAAVDRVRDRFGYHAVHLATSLGRGARRQSR
jgi:hypothetical protein